MRTVTLTFTFAFAFAVALVASACGDDAPSDPDASAGDPDASADAAPMTCDERAPLPVAVETLDAFATTEDFAFDREGNFVAVENGDLVAIDRAGARRLVIPGIADDSAGTHFLPDGDLVVARGSRGELIRVTPEGAVSTLIAGLLYPNGLDIARDGTIYVAEMGAARLRTVDPETGEFRIVAVGLDAPNGVALRDDEAVVYVGSFGGAVVYEVDLTNPDPLTRSRIFGRTPGGALTPEPVAPCAGLGEDESCTGPLGAGVCASYGGALDCLPVDPCQDAAPGDACADAAVGAGTCESQDGILVCTAPHCETAGAGCFTDDGAAGMCAVAGAGLACHELACLAHEPEESCTTADGAPGYCSESGAGELSCIDAPPCTGAVAADPCTTYGDDPGVCAETRDGLECVEATCAGQAPGAPCLDGDGHTGACAGESPSLWCEYDPPCNTLPEGTACITDYGVDGACLSALLGPTCEPVPGCAGSAGDACVSDRGIAGHCVLADGLICSEDDPCADHLAGEACAIDATLDGACVEDGEALTCAPPPCTNEGRLCHGQGDASGTCQPSEGGDLACDIFLDDTFFDVCADRVLGAACQVERLGQTFVGTCGDAPGALICNVVETILASCEGLGADDPCNIISPFDVFPGTCLEDERVGGLVCVPSDGGGGGLDGLNVDACGYVYVTEYILGIVWRIAPDGVVAKVAELDSSWIPNLHWGSGIGGWDPQVLYVTDVDSGRLFGLPLAVPGAHE